MPCAAELVAPVRLRGSPGKVSLLDQVAADQSEMRESATVECGGFRIPELMNAKTMVKRSPA